MNEVGLRDSNLGRGCLARVDRTFEFGMEGGLLLDEAGLLDLV